MSAAEERVLSTKRGAATVVDAGTVFVVAERGRAAALPGMVQQIRDSPSAEKVDAAAKSQSQKSQKPSFVDVSGQVSALAQDSKERNDSILEMLRMEEKKNRVLQQENEAALARRAGSMDTVAQAMVDLVKLRTGNQDPHSLEQKHDREDLKIAMDCKKEMKTLKKGSPLYEVHKLIQSNAMERAKQRKKLRTDPGPGDGAPIVMATGVAGAAVATGGTGVMMTGGTGAAMGVTTGGIGAAVQVKVETFGGHVVVDLLSDDNDE